MTRTAAKYGYKVSWTFENELQVYLFQNMIAYVIHM